MNRHLSPIAALLAAGCSACLYLPPIHNTTGLGTVEKLDAAPSRTRADVEHGLGKRARVLRKQGIYVYDWTQSYGYLLFGGYGSGYVAPLQGKQLRALVAFDGENVVRFERAVYPRPEGNRTEPPAAAAPSRVRNGCTKDVRCTLVAIAEDDRPLAVDTDGNLWTWDGDAARQLAPAPTDKGPSLKPSLAVSADGRFVAFGRYLDTVVFDLRDERTRAHVARPKGPWYGISPRPSVMLFAPDASTLAILGAENVVHTIDPAGWVPGEFIKREGVAPIEGAVFVPGTTRLLTLDTMGRLAYYDVRTGEAEPPLISGKGETSRRLAIAPDGVHIVLVTNASVEHWDLRQLERERDEAGADNAPTYTDGAPTRALRGVQLLPFPEVPAACPPEALFAPDGLLVAVSVGDRIGLFPAEGGPAARWLSAPGQALCGLAFSRDGSRLFATTPTGLAEWTLRLDGATSLRYSSAVPVSSR